MFDRCSAETRFQLILRPSSGCHTRVQAVYKTAAQNV